MTGWKVDRTAAIWGIVFGVLATLTGMFLLEAIEGGFVAEGFFLIVISWVIVLVLVAKLFQIVARWKSRYMESKPRSSRANRRTLHVISVLVVAITIALAGTLYYYLDAHRYPSEDTPLVLHSWGISWVMGQGECVQFFSESPFENISLWWTEFDSTSYGTPPLNSTIPRASMSEFELPDNVTTLFETCRIGWHSDYIVDGIRIIGAYGVFVTDENENGIFNDGDAISLFYGVYENGTLTQQGFAEDTEYGIGLSPPGQHIPMQFKYAIHHGRLYAWASD